MKDKTNILIIGAGMAGLTAAKLLQNSGFEVVVLEATARAGGRIKTVQLGDAALDAGASWIHFRKGNPLTYIAEAYGLEVVEDMYDSFRIWDAQKNKKIGRKRFDYMDATDKAIEEGILFFKDLKNDTTATQFIDNYIATKNWTAKKARLVRFLYRTWVETDYATSMDKASLADESYIHKFEDEIAESDGLIQGGYQQLISIFQEGLTIKYEVAVSAIYHGKQTIQVFTSKGIYECKKAILTVPLGVLKTNAITFNPPLPASKQAAIAAIGFGNLEKVILTFDTAFWKNKKETYFFEQADEGLVFPSIIDFTTTAKVPTLILFYCAQYAEQMQEKSDSEILQAALEVVGKAFATTPPTPTHHYISRWSKNPYFHGSYSYCSSPDNKIQMDILAEPIENKLLFAGEATYAQGQGYVHGALLSGIREAQRLGASTDSIKGLGAYLNKIVV